MVAHVHKEVLRELSGQEVVEELIQQNNQRPCVFNCILRTWFFIVMNLLFNCVMMILKL